MWERYGQYVFCRQKLQASELIRHGARSKLHVFLAMHILCHPTIAEGSVEPTFVSGFLADGATLRNAFDPSDLHFLSIS